MVAGEMNFAPTSWVEAVEIEGYAVGKKSASSTDATVMMKASENEAIEGAGEMNFAPTNMALSTGVLEATK